MFIEGNTLFSLAERLELIDRVEEISYQEYSGENTFNEGNAIFFHKPPKKFPEKNLMEYLYSLTVLFVITMELVTVKDVEVRTKNY